MMRARLLAVLAVAGVMTGVVPASAQDDGDRTRLNRVLGVLRLDVNAAGKACIAAMSNVHQTEAQVQTLTKDSKNTPDHPLPELDVARDVLSSDYETATEVCGPDAVRACQGNANPALAHACDGLNPPN